MIILEKKNNEDVALELVGSNYLYIKKNCIALRQHLHCYIEDFHRLQNFKSEPIFGHPLPILIKQSIGVS